MKFAEHASGEVPFPDRIALNTVALRFQYDHEQLIGDWARWAHEQVADWDSVTDPGLWDVRNAFPPPRGGAVIA